MTVMIGVKTVLIVMLSVMAERHYTLPAGPDKHVCQQNSYVPVVIAMTGMDDKDFQSFLGWLILAWQQAISPPMPCHDRRGRRIL